MRTITICVVALALFVAQNSVLSAQWEQTRGPYGGHISAIAVHNSKLYAGDWQYGVYSSADAGASWARITIQSDFEVSAIASNGNYLFLCSSGMNALRSSDGASWTEIGNAPLHLIVSTKMGLFAVREGTAFVRSTDDGTTWTLPDPTFVPGWITSITESDGALLVGTEEGVWRSTDDGTSWSSITGARLGGLLISVAVMNSNIYVSTASNGVYKSTNIGATWSLVNNGITDTNTYFIVSIGNSLLVSSLTGIVHRSLDEGATWVEAKVGEARAGLKSLVVDNARWYAGTDNGVYVSTDEGATWNATNFGLPPAGIRTMLATDTDLYAGTISGGIHRCDANGVDWTAANDPVMLANISAITSMGTDLFAAANSAFFRSTDAGQTWTMASKALTAEHHPRIGIYTLASHGQTLFAGTQSHSVYRSTDDGVSWDRLAPTTTELRGLVVLGDYIFAGGLAGVYRSDNDGASWRHVNKDLSVRSMTVSGSRLLVSGWGGGIHSSIDSGSTFTEVIRFRDPVTSFATRGSTVVAGRNGSGFGGDVLLSTDFGESWASIKANLPTSRVEAVAMSKTHIYIGGENPEAGIWRRPLSDVISDVQEAVELPRNKTSMRILSSPLTNSVTIALSVQNAARVTLHLFNVQGERVSTLLSEHREAGPYSFEWDASGVAGGMYYVHMQCADLSETTTMLLIR